MTAGLKYSIDPQHRDDNPKKSQWRISEADEEACFLRAHREGWQEEQDTYWSYYVSNGAVDYLGVAVDRARRLIVAKFVGKGKPLDWHGYPADHQMHQQDVPPLPIRNMWLKEGLMRPQVISKIGKQQRCRL